MEYTYKLTLSYDGTAYRGWQVQPGQPTVQQKLEEAVRPLVQTPTKVIGAGRTDAGVHAMGQVAHFRSTHSLDPKQLLTSLNGLLPPDIRILSVTRVPCDFHARYSATQKCYRYHIDTKRVRNPFRNRYSWHYPYPLDQTGMHQCAALFVGTHNFTSFANKTGDGSNRDPIRTVKSIELTELDGELVLVFLGKSFLYKMVRNLVGALIAVGRGKLTPKQVQEILSTKKRTKAPPGAPAHGLFLYSVDYR